jgi:molybdopterin-guanine dinucleotide biosynthesis protein A
MLERAVAALREVCDEVVVVLPPEGGPLPPAGVRVARDAEAGQGPLAGLSAGLAVATR